MYNTQFISHVKPYLHTFSQLRMMHSEFSKSSKRRSEFAQVVKDLDAWDGDHDWKVFYPILFCITRWLGIQRCAELIARSPQTFRSYAESLRDKGMGPREFDPYKYKKRRGQVDAVAAGADDAAGDVDSEEEEEDRRVQEAVQEGRLDCDGYQPLVQMFDSMEAAAASAPAQEDMVESEDFNEDNLGARGRKKKNLLNKDVGITEVNLGRSCWMAGVLKPYTVLVEKLQVSKCPQQHLAARRIREFYMQLEIGWVGTRTSQPLYPSTAFQCWIREMKEQHKDDLIDLVKTECRSFAGVLLASVRKRLEPTWNWIQCLELIDPRGPDITRFGTQEVWEALEDFCSRRDIDFEKCRLQIIEDRSRAPSLDTETRGRILHDLVGYCRERQQSLAATGTGSDSAELDALRCTVFSLGLVSAFVESLFSKMEYNQSKTRNRLASSTMSSILHVHDALVADPCDPLSSTMKLKTQTPSMSVKENMKKHIHKVVCKVFPADGIRYHGRVVGVDFHEIYARWMYMVVYTDGDKESYWRSELTMLLCTCTDINHDDIIVPN